MKAAYKDVLSLVGVAAGFAIVLTSWKTMPSRIAIHYNLAGQPNGYGSPQTLLLLPAVAGTMWLLFAVVRRAPSLYNLPVSADHPRRGQVAAVASELIGALSILITWSFALMTWSAVEGGRRTAIWHPPMLLCTVLLTVGTPAFCAFYLVRMRRAANA